MSRTEHGPLRTAFEKTAEVAKAQPIDAALVEAGRQIAERVDVAIEHGEGQDVTKALYLVPHLVNILKELHATPAARHAAGVAKETGGGKLAQLRAVQGGRRSS